jgi:hypothetical protein
LWSPTASVLAADQPDAKPALPTQADLPEFAQYRVLSENKGKSVWAKRRSDEANLRVAVLIAPTDVEARQWALRIVNTANGGMLPGAPSGRQVGQQTWQSKYPAGESARGAFTLIAQDGRAVSVVSLLLKIGKGKRGEAVQQPLAAADVRLVEDQARSALGKLTAMGYTSRSAASKAHRKP